jgi:hypothetical protein
MTDKEKDRLARLAARRYKRRCWWADEDDLKQEAWRAILGASRTFDPTRGTPLGAYLWASCMRWLRGVVLKASAPVSAGWGSIGELAGLLRAEVPVGLACSNATPEEIASSREWRRQLRNELLAVAGDDVEFVCRVLDGQPIVKGDAPRFFSTARSDLRLYQIWRE